MPKPLKNSLTIEDVEALIVKEEAVTLGIKTTAVVITLENGFEVVGLSSCVDPEKYNIEFGKNIARQRALDKVWEVAGYKLQADLFENMDDRDGVLPDAQKTVSFDDDDIPF